MRTRSGALLAAAALLASLLGASPASAAGPTAGERELRYLVPYIRRHDLPVNLGPTGASGYVCRHWIVVKDIEPGTPAHDALRRWDILTGANARAFAEGEDPRKALGRAVTEAEAGRRKGALALDLLRDGKRLRVEVPLRVLGPYSSTWPFACRKSEAILADACRFVAERSQPDRGATGHREFNALLLLASGELRYRDVVRRTAYRLVDDPLTSGYQGWSRSFAGILLGEYYLATGDPTVVPKLHHLAKVTAAGQMRCGSWGHRMPWGAYGAVNQIGLMCFLTLVLCQEAGAPVDPAAMQRSTDFFAKYAGKGWVPYGDHVPWRGTSGNGKNASAAIVFDLLGSHPEAVQAFARSVAASYDYREVGHTGAYFSFLWGPPGAYRAPRPWFRKFLDDQAWYYDLVRTPGGGLVCQPNPENLSGRTPGHYTQRGPEWTTGGMALLYALPQARLRILGAPKGVFGQRPPALRKALELWHAKRWREVGDLLKGSEAPAAGLLGALKRMEQDVALTLDAIEANVGRGDVFLASEQLKALERLLGERRPKMAELARALEGEAVAAEIELGRDYYKALGGYRRHRRTRGTMSRIATRGKGYYAKRAAAALAQAGPPPEQPQWEALVPPSSEKPQQWRLHQWDAGDPPPGWSLPDFDDAAWPAATAPLQGRKRKGAAWSKQQILLRKAFDLDRVDRSQLCLAMDCPAGTEVYLNGYRVVEIVSTPRRPYEAVPLHDKAIELLRKGRNVLAVRARKGRSDILDVGLRAAKAKGK